METEISVERAVELITGSVQPLGVEEIPATQAHRRVLAAPVRAPIDQPPWPRSPLDGYALHAADSALASRETPAVLRVTDTIYAGGWSGEAVGSGECVRLMTGAPIPAGCDCVIRQEDTDVGTEQVQIFKSLRPWENYCFPGEDFKKGDILLAAGTRLSGNALGILASAGLLREEVSLPVCRVPRCALLCTGDELVPNTLHPLPPGKIYSSNEAVLCARLRELGMEVASVRSAFDDAAALAAEIREAMKIADMVLTTGGVSVGAKDILHETLPLLGAERLLWRVALKPGSPLMYSLYEQKPILSLSGNPFAASATFELFARPLFAQLAGAADLALQVFPAVLDTPFQKHSGVRRFVRGVFCGGHVTLPEGHSSGLLRSAAGTNCLAEIPADAGPLPAGCTITVYLL